MYVLWVKKKIIQEYIYYLAVKMGTNQGNLGISQLSASSWLILELTAEALKYCLRE